VPDHWVLYGLGVVVYLACLFTAGAATLRKGHLVLLIAGVFVPLLWFLGWALPARTSRRSTAT